MHKRLIFCILEDYFQLIYLMKNTSPKSKDTKLYTTLEQHFSKDFNKQRIRLISFFIVALIKVRSVNYNKISNAFDVKAIQSSSYRRIQRFMSSFDFSMKIISTLIFKLLPKQDKYVLIIDRTNWKFGTKNINILMLGISYKNVAFPLMFKMLDKRGNSNIKERIELLNQYIEWFGKDTIDMLLADREFVGDDWLSFLNNNNIQYYIRIRQNFKIYSYQEQKTKPVFWLFNNLKINTFTHYPKIMRLDSQDVYLSGSKVVNREGKIEFLIIVSFNKPEHANEHYKERWQIETLFKALKSSGFNMEETHVTDIKRLERLLLLVMIAFVWCYIVGDYLDTKIKNIKLKKHKRKEISVFKLGLDFLSKGFFTNFKFVKVDVYNFLSCT